MNTVTVRAWPKNTGPVTVELSKAEIVVLYREITGDDDNIGHRDLARFLFESIDHPLNGWLERLHEALTKWVEVTCP